MIVKLTRVNPSYSAENVTISYDVSIIDASYAVAYNNIAPATIELGRFLLRHVAFDVATFGDIVGINVTKPLADVGQVSDGLSFTVEYARSFFDTSTTADAVTLDMITAQIDLANFSDILGIEVSRILSEAPSVLDSSSFDVSKAPADAIGVDDDLIFGTIKQLSDYGDVTELHSIVIGLSKEELPVINDFLSFALDVAQQDGASLGDALQIAFSFGRILSNSGQISDSQLVEFTKNLQDTSSAADVLNYVAIFFRSFADDAAVQDVAATEYQTTKTDAASFIDSITVILLQVINLADSAQFIDVLQFQLSPGKDETALLVDGIDSKDVGKIISEQLYGAADSPSMEFAKPVPELGFVGESLASLVAKVTAETPSVGDSGNLTTQTYAAEDYFLEDYCGHIRNF